MKKALSVLLVAAALFGFYGSAVTVNDLLACKDYWEEAGEKSTADMNKLEDGLNQLKDNEQAYLDGLDQVADGEKQLAEGEATLAKGEADYAAAPAKLAKGKADLAAGWAAYNDGKKTYDAGKKERDEGRKKLDEIEAKVGALATGFKTWDSMYDGAKAKLDAKKGTGTFDTMVGLNTPDVLEDDDIDAIENMTRADAVAGLAEKEITDVGGTAITVANIDTLFPILVSGAESAMNSAEEAWKEAGSPAAPDPTYIAYATAKGKYDLLSSNYEEYSGGISSLESMKGLVSGRGEITSQVLGFVSTIDEETMKSMDPDGSLAQAINLLKNPQLSDKNGVYNFKAIISGLMAKVQNLIDENEAKIAAADKQLKEGKKTLDAGLKKLKKGEADYAQGLKDYAAAPGKLADGRQQLEDGRQALADGKAQLAQYEDGEQQIRDGLATLFNTEADLELESIANRLNGDGDFDNGDNHLEIEEGLNAVDVGRGYQAEDGVLITNEIMGRAVATGGLLAAAVLAVLAAILSFLNKNKGAGVFAILAAVAGAFGAFYGPAQGTYFSEIAGSTIGATTWVAAGVLGAVALVHAIAHFAAKKAA